MSHHTLTLMRHAKSSWNTPGQADHERELNARGNRDAPAMAQRLKNKNCVPDLIVSSSATRALMTAQHLLDTFDSEATTLQIEQRLYLASPSTILKILKPLDAKIQHIMVVAHNPGLEELCALLANKQTEPMPTAAIYQFTGPQWTDWAELAMVMAEQPADLQSMDANTDTAAIKMIYNDYPKNLVS